MLLAAAELAAGDSSSEEEHQNADSTSSRQPRSPRSSSSSPSPMSSSILANTTDTVIEDSLSQNDWILRFEAVRSQMGTFVLSHDTILEHLRHVKGNVEAAVASLKRAHNRRYTNSVRNLGGRTGDLELPDRVRNIRIEYFRSGEQERRQAADILFLLVAQHNATCDPGTAIPLARSEAVLILDAAGFDFEGALRLLKDRELATQLLHIRFDKLRTRYGTATERLEQDDAALAFYVTLTDRADLHTLQLHLSAHDGDVVAAIADWQQNGVDPVRHPKDQGQTDSQSWIGRRRMIQEDGHKIILRPMPTHQEVHEYTARNLSWRQEPHRFALTTTQIGAEQQEAILRDAPATRGSRPYGFIINHDRRALSKGCPNPRKFLIEYLEQGKYRVNGYDVINDGMKVRTGRYFWAGKGKVNTDGKPVFDVNNRSHRKHFNNLYRQGYHRPTGVLARDPATEWSGAEMTRLWQLFAGWYEELVDSATRANTEVLLPFNVPEAKKQEIAKEIEKVDSEERSANSIITMAHRSRQLCKDFVFTFDVSNEVRQQGHAYRKMRHDQIDRVSRAIKQEGKSLSAEDILATIERISGSFVPFEWDPYMQIDAAPPQRQLPSTGLHSISLSELQAEVQRALTTISAAALDASAWEQAAQAVRYYYRSRMRAEETASIQTLLVQMGLRTLNLQALGEEEGLALFEGLARKEQRKQSRDEQEQLKSLVAISRLALSAGPASLPSGGQLDRDDVESFGLGAADGTDGWLTDQAIEAGLQTLALRNTAIVNMHAARLHFDNPTQNPLPMIDTSAENIALVMHFGNHWAVGIYNTTAQQYHLLDSMPIGPARFSIMAQRMDAIVAHYCPSHGQATQASSRSFQQENARDCGLYVIENVRSMDSGMPLREVNGVEARLTILSEALRLVRQAQAQAATTSGMEVDGVQADAEIPSGGNKLGLASEYYNSDYD